MKSVYSALRAGSLNKAVCSSSLKGYISAVLPHNVFIYSFLVSQQTATAFPIQHSPNDLREKQISVRYKLNLHIYLHFSGLKYRSSNDVTWLHLTELGSIATVNITRMKITLQM
jgi:hypothetical protein